MITISIIVPVYKSEKYLKDCINSILCQTFTDFELILVDDGSPDNCPHICDEWAQKDGRIVVVHKQNGGVSSARNSGLEIARGKYIMFCDSDDFVHPDWCKLLYTSVQSHPNHTIVSDFATLRNDNDVIQPSLLNETIEVINISYLELFKRSISPYIFNKIYNKSIIDKNNIRFDESIYLGEDELFNINYLSFCEGILYLPVYLYFYRINPSSITNTHTEERLIINLEMFSERLRIINIDDLGVFCDIYLYLFMKKLDDNIKNLNTDLLTTMQHNNRMMNTEEFKYCVEHASGEKESALFMTVVRMHNYYIYWIFQKLAAFKAKIFKRKVSE